MLLCKCMNENCRSIHFGDLSKDKQFQLTGECPDDTDGDGNCGKIACPYCGKNSGDNGRAVQPTMYGIRGHLLITPEEDEQSRREAERILREEGIKWPPKDIETK